MSETKTEIIGEPRGNRFDFLRLVFASGVFVFHLIILSSTAPTGNLQTVLGLAAEISIQGFFIISGALVYGSWLNSAGLKDYFGKRLRRLYPAYLVIILIPALISLILTGELANIARYLVANLTFLNFIEPNLPGLFAGHPHPEVNGALWTLKIEVMFYAVLPVLAWILTRSGKLKWALLVLIYLAAELWRAQFPTLDTPYAAQIARQLPGQMSFFVTGMALWLTRDWLIKQAKWVGLAGTAILLLSYMPGLEPTRAIGLTGVVAAIAYVPGPPLNAARWGDISYGVYITHFPLVNAAVALGLFQISPWLGIAASFVAVIFTSLVLWKFVEKPFLRRSSHYRRAERR